MRLNRIHRYPALISILLIASLLAGSFTCAIKVEDRYVNGLAPLGLSQANKGDALQEAVLRQKDLLLVYGSSEMAYGDTQYRSINFFGNYPTNFEVFQVAKAGITSLTIAQDIAALGQDIRGKKVVISFTPSMFTNERVNEIEYTSNFSRLHALELVYSPYLTYRLKQAAARRMIEYPKTIDKDALLHFGVIRLTDNSLFSRVLYIAAYPIAFLDIFIIKLQDHWAVLNYLLQHPKLSPHVTRQTMRINWSKLMIQAYIEQKLATSSNPYGVEDPAWKKMEQELNAKKKSPASGDKAYLQNLNKSQEWVDFDILLQTLRELGAQPLIMSHPIDGTLYDFIGISAKARYVYYQKLSEEVGKYGFPLVDFRNYEMDKYFTCDLASHTGRVGWVYVNETLDEFYHNTLLIPEQKINSDPPVILGGQH
jgi:D-alanine transfer protein